MIKLLGFLDFLSAVLLFLVFLNAVPAIWLVSAAFYLIIKGWIFLLLSRDIASIGDLTIGLFLLLFAFVNIPIIIMVIFLIWLLQKAVISFI